MIPLDFQQTSGLQLVPCIQFQFVSNGSFMSTLRFLINVPGHLLIFRFFSDPPDLIRTPHLLVFKYLTDEVVLFSSTFANCLSFCVPLIYQRYFYAKSIYIDFHAVFGLYFLFLSYLKNCSY